MKPKQVRKGFVRTGNAQKKLNRRNRQGLKAIQRSVTELALQNLKEGDHAKT